MTARHLVPTFAAVSLLLAACGGAAAPAASAPASSAAAKPSVAASAPASAKPAASASASAKPAASGAASAKPAASPKPTATTLPVVDGDTTKITLTKVPMPPFAGKTLSVDILEVDKAAHRLYVTDRTGGGIDVFGTSASPAK